MNAKYLVKQPPGAPTPVGFVNIGQIFTAPEGYVPSLTFQPVNEEAQTILEKAFDDRAKQLKDRIDLVDSPADKRALKVQLRELEAQRAKNLQIFVPEAKAPAIEEGITLKELGELEAKATAAIGSKVDAADVRGGSARKDDRKL